MLQKGEKRKQSTFIENGISAYKSLKMKYKIQCKSPQLQNGHSKYTELTEMYRH